MYILYIYVLYSNNCIILFLLHNKTYFHKRNFFDKCFFTAEIEK